MIIHRPGSSTTVFSPWHMKPSQIPPRLRNISAIQNKIRKRMGKLENSISATTRTTLPEPHSLPWEGAHTQRRREDLLFIDARASEMFQHVCARMTNPGRVSLGYNKDNTARAAYRKRHALGPTPTDGENARFSQLQGQYLWWFCWVLQANIRQFGGLTCPNTFSKRSTACRAYQGHKQRMKWVCTLHARNQAKANQTRIPNRSWTIFLN